jgi:hypothetical protein
VETPIFMVCSRCREPILPDAQGFLIPHVEMVGDVYTGSVKAQHLDCFLKGILPHGPDCPHCRGVEPHAHHPGCAMRTTGLCDCQPMPEGGVKVWHNIAASNNAWSSGVTPAHLAAIAKASPAVKVYDLSDERVIGVTSRYELREAGMELWALLELERAPGGVGNWHGESVLAKESDGRVQLFAVALTTKPRGFIERAIAARHPGKVGRL